MDRVAGKVAIVTGAARGMGAAFAQRLVGEGAKVMLTDILEEEVAATARKLGGSAVHMRHDVAIAAHWKQVVQATESVFGPVSVLVNNAGVGTLGPIDSFEESDYRRVIDINQLSVFLGMKSVLPSMKRAGQGAIINISSIAGLVGNTNSIAYTASKFAVRGMTKAAAVEFAPYHIRVNSIHPGMIQTPMVAAAMVDNGASLSDLSAAVPLARIGEPDEIANFVLLLASDESRFATGAEFVVDGGLTCR